MPLLNTFNSVSVRGFAAPVSGGNTPIPAINSTFLVTQSGRTTTAAFLTTDGGASWSNVTVPTGRYQAVVYASSRYVGLNRGATSSTEGTITSTDGITWTKTNTNLPGTNLNWNSVKYGSNRFVAIAPGNTSAAAYSSDGNIWTGVNLPGNSQTWQAMASNGDTFVVVGLLTNRTVRSINNGGSWANAGNLPSNRSLAAVAFGSGAFVAVPATGTGNSNIAVRSTNNGTNWANVTLPSNAAWQDITYGNNQFVAIATGNIAATSANGSSWTLRTLPSNASWRTVAYNNGVFMTVTAAGNLSARSVDGANWILTATLPPNSLSSPYITSGP